MDNIGYYFFGHLGDKLTKKTKDTPDGNAWYSSCIIHECLLRSKNVYLLGLNRDKDDYIIYGDNIFNSFEKKKRLYAYNNVEWVNWNIKNLQINARLPKLDILLLEWRFPISGRNTINSTIENFQPDLIMQEYILDYYKRTKTKVIIFDLDYKLTKEDEERLKKDFGDRITIFETSNRPKKNTISRISVEIPFWMNTTKIIKNKVINKDKELVYIGSNYEREETINKYIKPYSEDHPFTTWFYGNWKKYHNVYNRIINELGWDKINYCNRVGHIDFEKIYSDSIATPLLAKNEYYKRGFMTARIQECLYFGSVPIGFLDFYNINKYIPTLADCIKIGGELVDLKAYTYKDLITYVNYLKNLSIKNRNKLRQKIWKKLEFMDVSYFVDKMEQFCDK